MIMPEKCEGANRKQINSGSPGYLPTMTPDYSQISDTAKAVASRMLPEIIAFIQSISPQIARMSSGMSFTMADYGAADGVNSSGLFTRIIEHIHAINPSLKIKLLYIDIADRAPFDKFCKISGLAGSERAEAEYIQRSFYRPFPEITGELHLGFSSTSLHWLDTENVDSAFFQHPACIQSNQLPDTERQKFVEKWKTDWRVFFRERSAELVKGGALFLANLTNRGNSLWPASVGYNNLRDICHDLCREHKISKKELNAIFVPDYFATPEEINSLLTENEMNKLFYLKSCHDLTVPCAYFTPVKNQLDKPQVRADLADKLAHVVRAWSESSIRTGLSLKNKGVIEEIYRRLRDKFYETPRGLPYEYCLLALIKR